MFIDQNFFSKKTEKNFSALKKDVLFVWLGLDFRSMNFQYGLCVHSCEQSKRNFIYAKLLFLMCKLFKRIGFLVEEKIFYFRYFYMSSLVFTGY